MGAMPFLQLDFLTSELGRWLFAVWAVILVVCHMQYVHSRVDIGKTFVIAELVADLVGLTWMRNIVAADYPEMTGLHVFLFVHFVVHAASLVWSVVHWSSLDRHMIAFRRRELPAYAVASEWVYEQSDTALYAVLALKTLTSAPPPVAMAVVIGTSALFASKRLRGWLGGAVAS